MPSENNTPAIRFAGFTGEWERRKIKEIAHLITKGTTPLNKSNNGEVNFVKIENIDKESGEIYITQKISKEEHEGYLRRSQLRKNDILFSIAGTLGRVTYVKPAILPANTNQALAIIRTKEGNTHFITTFLKGKAVEEFIRKNPTTGAQPNLSLEQVSNIHVSLPCEAEQSSISAYFQELDTLITLHRRKCELLETLKKSMLEKLFPKEGELVPELRFAGFTGEWEWRNFGNIASRMCELSTERSLPRVEYEDIISERGVLNKDIKLKNCHKAGIRFDHQNVLYGKLRPYLHNWLLPEFTGIAVGDFWVLLPQGIDRSFLFALIQSSRFDNVANQSTGTKMPRADWKLVSKSKFLVPIASGEQHQIGRFIYLIEECITLHRRKLKHLQNIKKACLEKMFV